MTGIFYKTARVLSLSWLTGPIFSKELRTSSRKIKSYVIRFLYLAFLLCIIILAWIDLPHYSQYNVSAYMAQVGQTIYRAVSIFQFFGVQVAAVLLLSSAISEEINKRTLGILLTTPITGMQVIAGKISSRLLQVFFLMCLSLPVLAIIRVFGGISWDQIVQTTCVTATTVIFVSSLVLFVSTIFKKNYVVFILTSVFLGLLYISYNSYWIRKTAYQIFGHRRIAEWFIQFANPYALFMDCFEEYGRLGYLWGGIYAKISLPASLSGSEMTIFTILRCTAIAVVSLVLVALSAWRIRKVALKQIIGETKKNKKRLLKTCEALINKLPRISRQKAIRTVRGQAVVWKEMHNSLIRNELLRGRMSYVVLVTAILIVFFLIFIFSMGANEEAIHFTLLINVSGACLMSAVTAAASISKEKETSSWQILLCTPLTNGDIIRGKLAGVLRRSCALWFVLYIFCAVLAYSGLFDYSFLYMVPVIAIGTIALIAGVGMYFSLKCKSMSHVMMVLIGIMTVLWVLPTVILFIRLFRYYYYFDVFEIVIAANPYIQVKSLFNPSQVYYRNFSEKHIFIFINSILYSIVGLLFLWRTKVIIRKNII